MRRAAKDARPLGLKLTANKTIAGVINHHISIFIHEVAAPAQKGFVRARSFIEHIVGVDCRARAASSFGRRPPASRSGAQGDWKSCMVAFDFAQACPSIRQAWAMLCVRLRRLPAGLVSPIDQLSLIHI
eukprot:31453-Pyramimonas_sp.AAC.1